MIACPSRYPLFHLISNNKFPQTIQVFNLQFFYPALQIISDFEYEVAPSLVQTLLVRHDFFENFLDSFRISVTKHSSYNRNRNSYLPTRAEWAARFPRVPVLVGSPPIFFSQRLPSWLVSNNERYTVISSFISNLGIHLFDVSINWEIIFPFSAAELVSDSFWSSSCFISNSIFFASISNLFASASISQILVFVSIYFCLPFTFGFKSFSFGFWLYSPLFCFSPFGFLSFAYYCFKKFFGKFFVVIFTFCN